ncbi:MAG TPA: hypothetical protein VHD32_00980 [Candidatus Didemnitutus sp.]|nr:hypothetical protein [Candidatus Didemnitutus sp.]
MLPDFDHDVPQLLMLAKQLAVVIRGLRLTRNNRDNRRKLSGSQLPDVKVREPFFKSPSLGLSIGAYHKSLARFCNGPR